MKIDFDEIFTGYEEELTKSSGWREDARDRFLKNPMDPLSGLMYRGYNLGAHLGKGAAGVYNLASGTANLISPPEKMPSSVPQTIPSASTNATQSGTTPKLDLFDQVHNKLQQFRAAGQRGEGREFVAKELENLWDSTKVKAKRAAGELANKAMEEPLKLLQDNAIPIGLTGVALTAYMYNRHKKKQQEEAKRKLLEQQQLQLQQQALLQRAAPQAAHQPHITIQNILPSQRNYPNYTPYQKYGSEKSADMVDALASSVGRRMVDKVVNHAVSPVHPKEEHKEKELEITSKYPEMEKMLKKKKNKEYLEKLLKD